MTWAFFASAVRTTSQCSCSVYSKHDFGGDVFDSRVERIQDHGVVPFPGRGDDDPVQVLKGQQVAVGIVAAGEYARHRFSGLGNDVFGPLQHPVVDVAKGSDLHVLPAEGQGEVAFAAQAGADDGEADAIDGARGFRARC